MRLSPAWYFTGDRGKKAYLKYMLKRGAAAMVDQLILAPPAFFILAVQVNWAAAGLSPLSESLLVDFVLVSLPFYLYKVVTESALEGTPGKLIVGSPGLLLVMAAAAGGFWGSLILFAARGAAAGVAGSVATAVVVALLFRLFFRPRKAGERRPPAGLRVIGMNYQRIRWHQAAVRNITLVIPYVAIADQLVVLVRGIRIGDILARTVVVDIGGVSSRAWA
jgi:hypothetical protein